MCEEYVNVQKNDTTERSDSSNIAYYEAAYDLSMTVWSLLKNMAGKISFVVACV